MSQSFIDKVNCSGQLKIMMNNNDDENDIDDKIITALQVLSDQQWEIHKSKELSNTFRP